MLQTRTRLGAAAGPADANDGEAIADVDVVRSGGLLQLRCFSFSGLLECHSNGRQVCCALQVFCEPQDQRAMQTLGHHKLLLQLSDLNDKQVLGLSVPQPSL